ncbi:hypothetical protein H5410_061859 [Solanum commersonii]|uniref:Uncharacterized protein n=1 Tax=Solanum commersonii TaxID=4109 RepID=A0A9J5W926_SOLCO|nr:hypothetical protein H5410_061859 [Solanum commersonii]
MDKVLIRFRSRTRDTYSEFVPIPKQHEAAENYTTNSYSPQYLNEHSDRNKPSLAHTLFKEMLGGETNCFRDETMVLPETQVDHMFDKMLEKCNEADSLDNTSVGSNIDIFDDMDSRPISSVPSLYDQMVSDPNLSINPTKDEALGFPNKPVSELSV